MSKQQKLRLSLGLSVVAVIAVAVVALSAALAPTTTPQPEAPRTRQVLLPGGGTVEVEVGQSDGPTISGPIISEPIYPAVRNIDVRELPQVGPTVKDRLLPEHERPGREGAESEAEREAEEEAKREGRGEVAEVDDPVAQKSLGTGEMPAPLSSFAGLDHQNWGAGWPPDTNGDVGPVYYIQTVNTSIGIYTKTTGARVAAFTFDTFFDGTGTPCDANNQGDPIVLYDPQADRWIITDFAWSNLMSGPYYECIAVSQTNNPVTGGWYMYGFMANANYLDDYPKLGVWPDAYYMSVNLFDCTNSTCSTATWQGVQVYAFKRAALLAGQALTSVSFNLSAASNYGALLPSNLRGAQPPAGSPNYFISADENWSGSNDVLHLWKFHVDWNTPGNSTFTGPTDLVAASFVMPTGSVPQLSGESLDTLGDRLMMQLQYRNLGGTESLWVNHTVSTGGVTGIRWYELRAPNTTPIIYQQGTYQPDTTYRWMGSIAVDAQGNAAIGYSASSSSMYPAIRYAGRLAGDPLGQLTQGEATLIAGTGSQSGGYNRWGDYSALTVDPVDDCTFWYTTEYYITTGSNWQTRIGSFKFPGCVSAVGTLQGVVSNKATGNPIVGAQVQAANVAQSFITTTASGGLYSLGVPSGTYTVTSVAPGYMQFITTGIQVPVSQTVVLNIALEVTPTYVITGFVHDAYTHLPLAGTVNLSGTGKTANTDPATGYYSITVQTPSGSYLLTASAAQHTSLSRVIALDHNQQQDFDLAPICLLVVDGDGGQNYDTYYTAALDQLGKPYDRTTTPPDLATLAQYNGVIWLTGVSGNLSESNQAALADYLNGGGRLFLSGQDIGLNLHASDFYTDYLHSKFLADDSGIFTLTGQAFLSGLNIVIKGAGGANNQFYPDGIAAQPEGTAIYQYTGSPLLGGVAYSGTHRTVNFSFGFEAINSASQRQAVMNATLNYLGVCGTPAAPTASFVVSATANVNEPTIFTNTSIGAPFMTYSWDFGDGVTDTLSAPQVVHTYAAGGVFTPTLTASNAYGTDSFSAPIAIASAPEPLKERLFLPMLLK